MNRPPYSMKINRELFEDLQGLPYPQSAKALFEACTLYFEGEGTGHSLPKAAGLFVASNKSRVLGWRKNAVNGAKNRPRPFVENSSKDINNQINIEEKSTKNRKKNERNSTENRTEITAIHGLLPAQTPDLGGYPNREVGSTEYRNREKGFALHSRKAKQSPLDDVRQDGGDIPSTAPPDRWRELEREAFARNPALSKAVERARQKSAAKKTGKEPIEESEEP